MTQRAKTFGRARATGGLDAECGVNVAFGVVGSKWKPTIMWRLAEGDRRFADLRRAVGGVSEKVLTSQLRQLERDGLVTRTAYPGFPLRVEYALTERGAELNAALDAVAEWGDRHAGFLASARAAAVGGDGTSGDDGEDETGADTVAAAPR